MLTKEIFADCVIRKEDNCLVFNCYDNDSKKAAEKVSLLANHLRAELGNVVMEVHGTVCIESPGAVATVENSIAEINRQIQNQAQKIKQERLLGMNNFFNSIQINMPNALIAIQLDHADAPPRLIKIHSKL